MAEQRRGEKTRLELARQAFEERDVEMSKLTHAQPAREGHASGGEFVKSVAFGGLDGIITTFAIVCTVAGAGKPPGYVLLFGVANLVADALSMGVGDFLSTKSEIDFSRVERALARALGAREPRARRDRGDDRDLRAEGVQQRGRAPNHRDDGEERGVLSRPRARVARPLQQQRNTNVTAYASAYRRS